MKITEIVDNIIVKVNSKQNLTDIHNATSKPTPVDADEIGVQDSASSFSLKKFTWANLKATLSSLFVSKVVSTDNAVVRFNGTDGEVQNSLATIEDDGSIRSTGLKIVNSGNGGIYFYSSTADVSASTLQRVFAYNAGNDSIVLYKYTNGTYNGSLLTINSVGNVGIGVTPSAWFSGRKAIDFSTYSLSDAGIFLNAYEYQAGGWKYKANGYANLIQHSNGSTNFYTAPSGTAGNDISWSTTMTLTNSGNLLLGTTTDNGVDNLQINGTISAKNDTLIKNVHTIAVSGTATYLLPIIANGILTVLHRDVVNFSKLTSSVYIVTSAYVGGASRVMNLQQIGTSVNGVSGSCPFGIALSQNSSNTIVTITNTNTGISEYKISFSGYKTSNYLA